MILLFDVDGTLVESGQVIEDEILQLLKLLKEKGHRLGLVGGGTYENICRQITDKSIFEYIFAECGSLIFHNDQLVHQKKICEHPQYHLLDPVIKLFLSYLATVPYHLTGHFIDRRNGLIYLSLIGMQASLSERKEFIQLDNQFSFRKTIKTLIEQKLHNTDFEVTYGGSVGLAIYPTEWNKSQVATYFQNQLQRSPTAIHYFGDKYTPEGNDYPLLTHPMITPHNVDHPNQTAEILKDLLSSHQN